MAVFTKLNPVDFENILASYDLGNFVSSHEISEGVENTNYILVTDRNKFIFTVYEKRVKKEDLPFFMSLLENLSGRNFPCPTPLHQKNGKVVDKFGAKNYTIVSMLAGKWPRRIENNEAYKAGQNLGLLHKSTSNISKEKLFRANSMGKDFWIETYSKIREKAEMEFSRLAEYTSEALEKINNEWPGDLPSGIIHGDYFPDNVLFENDDVSGVIDFYMSCNDFYSYDLAIAVNAWCFEKDGAFNITKAAQMLKGYQEIRQLSEEEMEKLPVLFIGACLRFLSTRLYDYFNRDSDAVVNIKDPREYIEKLKFHLQVKSYKEYGF